MDKSNFQKVIEFHTSFGLPYSEQVNLQNLQDFKIASLRVKLIREEYNELLSAINITEQLDAIGDLLYVVYGAGVSFGINLDDAFYNSIRENVTCNEVSNILGKSNFRQIYYTKREIGNLKGVHFIDIDSDQNKIIRDFNSLIHQFAHAILLCYPEAVTDILVNMLKILYTFGCIHNYDLDVLFSEIHTSNMSKLCNTEQDAISAVEWYKLNCSDRYPEPSYIKIDTLDKWVVFDKTTDKRLKSIYYSSPKIHPEKLRTL